VVDAAEDARLVAHHPAKREEDGVVVGGDGLN
jgi:hypothetical protein